MEDRTKASCVSYSVLRQKNIGQNVHLVVFAVDLMLFRSVLCVF